MIGEFLKLMTLVDKTNFIKEWWESRDVVASVKDKIVGVIIDRYNDFIKALLSDDVDSMNDFMNNIALQSFSSFDSDLLGKSQTFLISTT